VLEPGVPCYGGKTGPKPIGWRLSLAKDDVMTRSNHVTGRRRCAAPALERPTAVGGIAAALLAATLLVLAGCSTSQQQTRAQASEDVDRYDVKTIGDLTTVANPEPVSLGGVGLVVGLEGTGGETAANYFRGMLEDSLHRQNVKNIKELISSSSVAVVVVEAELPPGAHKGDPLDVRVKIAPGCTATSLRGGYLQKCLLYNYDFARNLSPTYHGPDMMLLGHPIAAAEGALLVGMGNAEDDSSLKQGRIWNGGRARVDQPFGLILNPDKQSGSLAGLVTERINETFQIGARGINETKMADFKNKVGIALRVPPQYKLNLPRYLRIVRLIPLRNLADLPGTDPNDRRTYRQRLAGDLLDPAHTVTVALRLEALGSKSIPALKVGLESPHPLVRFSSAEALAYLGSPSCGEELARAVAEQPLFRAFGLAALASLDEAVCQVKLRELLLSATDDETRVGAFRALHTLNERNPAIHGEQLNESFWLHKAAPGTKPLIHISSTHRAEIILFGEESALKAPFSILAGEFAITATDDEDRCMVSRFPLRGSPMRKQCGLKLEEIIRTMADLGALYPEVVGLLQQAQGCGSLTCRVRVDALPQAATVYDLARVGRGESPDDLLPGGQDLGSTPSIFAVGRTTQSDLERDQEAMLREKQPKRTPATASGKAPVGTATAE
jgi:hypothetical protein